MMILGLDIGGKRIGVARTDELGIMAHAVGYIKRSADKEAIAEIRKLVLEWKVETLVLGLPREMSGRVGVAAEKVMKFGDLLKQELPDVVVHYWDERLSSKSAERFLIESDVSRARRRQVIDKLAAQAILQNYLEAHKKRVSSC